MLVQAENYPQLRLLCWNRADGGPISGQEALALYEANWRHVDQEALTPEEQALLKRLAEDYGNGVLNV